MEVQSGWTDRITGLSLKVLLSSTRVWGVYQFSTLRNKGGVRWKARSKGVVTEGNVNKNWAAAIPGLQARGLPRRDWAPAALGVP